MVVPVGLEPTSLRLQRGANPSQLKDRGAGRVTRTRMDRITLSTFHKNEGIRPQWSRWQELNPRLVSTKHLYFRCTTPANVAPSRVEILG